MSNCPECSHDKCVKDGIVKGKQRYKCKRCHYRHTVQYKWATKSQKRLALEMYLEGLGFRSIGRILKFSHVTIYSWIKTFGSKIEGLKSESDLKIVEMDEMHSYIGQKKTTVGSGFLLIEIGGNSSVVFLDPGGK